MEQDIEEQEIPEQEDREVQDQEERAWKFEWRLLGQGAWTFL